MMAQNLLSNGDFEGGMVDWIGNAFNVQTAGDNSFNFANVETAGDAFAVNLSQVVEIVMGETYTLTFDAGTDDATGSRTMIAGIGLNEGPFTADIETVTLVSGDLQTFELTFVASFGLANSRVLFDMGADTGVIVIDNVVLEGPEGMMGGGDVPTVAAPTPPMRDAASVFSVYSDAYTDQPNVTFGAFSVGTLDITEIDVAGDNVQQIGFVQPDSGFLLVDWAALVDNTALTHFHMDIWIDTDLSAGLVVNPIWSNHVGDMGETSSFGLTNPVSTFGEWISIDVPIADFDFGTTAGEQQRDALRQFIMTVAGADNGARTVFLDNLYLHDNTTTMGGGDVVELPVDFELPAATYDFGGFEGAVSSIEANPDVSGENTSATVLQTIKTDGAQFFAGTFLNLDSSIGFTEDLGAIAMQTWSPKSGIPVRMRLENADNSAGVELDVNTTVVGEWETLTYDFSAVADPNVEYVRVVVFFEFIPDLPGDGSTYFFDNLELAMVADDSDPVELPVDFEDDANLDYDFLGFEGAISTLEANPDPSGINTSATVLQSIKTDGAQFFAGTFLNLDAPIPFTADLGAIEIDTWSPKAGIPVRVRLEDAANTAGIELDVNTTVVGEWETLNYDFSTLADPTVDYVRIVVFFEFIVDLPGDGSTYFLDNLRVAQVLSTDDFSTVNVTAFPNPSSNNWNISASAQTITSVEVYDILGQRVAGQKPNANNATIDASRLSTGMYIATISTNEGSTSVKLIKN